MPGHIRCGRHSRPLCVRQVPFPGQFVERVAAGLQHAAALVRPAGRWAAHAEVWGAAWRSR